MTPQEAIISFNALKAGAASAEVRERSEIAVSAIERCMVAKKPDYEGDGYDENGELIYDTAYCPSCRHMFEVDYDAVKHCPNCGQLIDWSDTE